jgi:hypothetical protein
MPRFLVIAFVVLGATGGARAAVSPADAQRLGRDLTPAGAERAGNAAGSIPAWTGGATGAAALAFLTREPKLFSITAANARAYADKLPEGALALFARFPDYRMDIYPTHRTAALPQRVYDAIRVNAVSARPAAAGIAHGVQGAAGGIPFPIPESGGEIVWNHLLAFWGNAREAHLFTYVSPGDGDLELATSISEITDFPYYDAGANASSFGRYYFKTRHAEDGPARKAGQAYIAWQPIDDTAADFVAWRSLPGQHRVRRGPSLAYDTPDPEAEGYQALDEYYLFFGSPDRYDFRLLGKKEMYIPYNNNVFFTLPAADVAGRQHANPDHLRYELHRVWVVEATLKAGKQHVVPRRRLYIDEDTWFAFYEDEWDEHGRLWKFGHGTGLVLPDVPAVILGSQFIYDLLQGGYVFSFALNGPGGFYKVTAPHGGAVFSAESLAAR